MDTNSLIYTLLHLRNWGPKKIHSYVSSCSFNFKKCVENLANILSDEEKIAFKKELVNSKKVLKINYDLGIKTSNILEAEFPKKLYSSTEKCVFLFYRGNIDLLSKKSIVIIGTRNPELEFIKNGIKATSYFSNKNYVIVSGLAIGCDSLAHKTCLDFNGKTIAVLPSPCDNIQPRSNKILAEKIVQSGGLLISEYSSGATISKYHYPQRDRIQSLLSSVILIIQASDNSGKMIAVKKNLRDGKIVYALKGNNLSLVKNYINVDSEYDLKEIENHII